MFLDKFARHDARTIGAHDEQFDPIEHVCMVTVTWKVSLFEVPERLTLVVPSWRSVASTTWSLEANTPTSRAPVYGTPLYSMRSQTPISLIQDLL